VPEGSCVGLAGFGGSGSDPLFEVPVRCHLAFHALARDPPAIPSEAADQDERPETGSPFAFSSVTELGPVDEGEARAAPDPHPLRVPAPESISSRGASRRFPRSVTTAQQSPRDARTTRRQSARPQPKGGSPRNRARHKVGPGQG